MPRIVFGDSGEIQQIEDKISFSTDDKSIDELRSHWEKGHLNLEPAFQRESVWSIAQRRKLIQSLYERFPVPSIFLFEREEDGETVYDVIDGKQRLESIFMFLGTRGFRGKRFWFTAKWDEDGEKKSERYYWRELSPKERQRILRYPIPTTTVQGSLDGSSDGPQMLSC